MLNLTSEFIQNEVADSGVIYKRGQRLYRNGAFALQEKNVEDGIFVYNVDGNYDDYTTAVEMTNGTVKTSCDCPYPGTGCKHTVAILLDLRDMLGRWQEPDEDDDPCLTPEEIRQQALEDRAARAKNEEMSVTEGDTLKGEHLVETPAGRQYTATLHDPSEGRGHCSCPDYCCNGLGTCKHLIFLNEHIKKKEGIENRIPKETFPFVDIYWDSVEQAPALFSEMPRSRLGKAYDTIKNTFDREGRFIGNDLSDLFPLLSTLNRNKRLRVQEAVINRMERVSQKNQLDGLSRQPLPSGALKAPLYPYQEEGVQFALYKDCALIGDEMGLGKTLQAIALAILKRQIFGFEKVLVVTLASLKEQWKREIERFSDETATVVSGNPKQRSEIYARDPNFFKLTNYEAVLRDVTILSRFKPDLIILDEAQRIKNFSTKTAQAVKQLPRKHALVLTGTPLENKLEDVYSIVQFLDPYLLTPLWKFAAEHFMLSRQKRGRILGYRNLGTLREKLAPIVIRRRKEDVLKDLPDEVVNNYYLDLHHKQKKIHAGYAQSLLPLLNKKYLTPMDMRRIQELLLRMRMVCNSTYLIDKKTHISPKLDELENIIDEIAVQNDRKMVIFSEWTTMTFLIARHLSDIGLYYVELSGKVPVKKRQALIDEFSNNRDCKVFLSTDAGGTGLNLQAADCVVNFELPWNPARMNQRIGRLSRIGQKSRCVNVVNLITKESIEEKIMAGLQLKMDLFQGVFEEGEDQVEFSQEKRNELLNKLRDMMEEEPVTPVKESAPAEEIPDDAPGYLNPQVLDKDVLEKEVLKQTDGSVDYTAEETGAEIAHRSEGAAGGAETDSSPEKMEAVLNSGMQFMSGLMEMATGQKMSATGSDDQMIKVDRETGEVTMKFKLPGF